MPYDYIFDDDITPAKIGCIFFAVIIAALSIWAFTGRKFYADKYGRKRRKWPLWMIVTIISLSQIAMQTYAGLHMMNLKKRMVKVNGTVTSRHWHHGRNPGWSVYFRYLVKGKSYESADARSYHDYERNSAHEGSQYVVLCDSTNPSCAIMDLHEPVKCDTCLNK